jgi:hypothetical protein
MAHSKHRSCVDRNRSTVERLSTYALDVRELRRFGLLDHERVSLTTGLRWPLISRIISERFWLTVDYWDCGISQQIRVSWTRCHLGGWRPWMHCPYCDRRVAKLLKGLSGYCCRACIGDPLYACQAKSTHGRRHFGLCKIRLQLGGLASPVEPFPERPKGMRRERYDQMRARALRLEQDLPVKHRRKPVDYRNLASYVP